MRSYPHAYKLLLVAGLVMMGAGAAMPTSSDAATDTSTEAEMAAIAAAAAAAGAGPAAPLAAPAPEPVKPTAAEARAARVENAVAALTKSVKKQSHSSALRVAFQAYYAYVETHPENIRNPYLYYVDYGLDNSTARGYVFNMETMQLVEGPFTVAHGRGSSKTKNGVPTRFSNVHGSAASSLGLYLTQETYAFRGKSGGRPYRSVGLRMRGVSGDYNDNARARGVVVHGAPYVSARTSGRSEGCPAMEEYRAQRLLPEIANGGLVFVFSPDAEWMRNDPWVNASAD